MSNNKKLYKNSVFYSLGTIFSKAIGFFLLPLYTSFLSDSSYGIATTITSFSATFSIVLMLSLRAALIRFYNNYDQTERKRFIGSILLFVIFNSILCVIILLAFKDLYIDLIFPNIEFFPTIFLGILALGFDAVYLTYQSYLQAKQDGLSYTLNSTIFLILHTILNVLFVVILKMDYVGMVLGLVCSEFIMAFYGTITLILKREVTFSFKFPYLKKALIYSIPILPHNLANNISTFVAKIILNNKVDYAASGLYSVAAQISSVMSLVQSSINLAFRPWFIEKMNQGEEGRKDIKETSLIIFKIYCICSIGVSLISQEIISILTSAEYRESWKLVPILTITLVITFIYYSHIQTIMYYVKKSMYAFICSFIGAFSNIIFSYFLASPLGSVGIAIAYLLSQVILATITVIISYKIDPIDFGLKKMIIYILISCIIVGIGLTPTFVFDLMAFNIYNLIFKFIFILFSIFIFGYTERKKILNFIRMKKKTL